MAKDKFTSHTTGQWYEVKGNTSSKTFKVIYLMGCKRCDHRYLGEHVNPSTAGRMAIDLTLWTRGLANLLWWWTSTMRYNSWRTWLLWLLANYTAIQRSQDHISTRTEPQSQQHLTLLSLETSDHLGPYWLHHQWHDVITSRAAESSSGLGWPWVTGISEVV